MSFQIYGIFYYWNAPENLASTLDNDGFGLFNIANFNRPILRIGSTSFVISKEIIKNGGIPYKLGHGESDFDEVDIIIKK